MKQLHLLAAALSTLLFTPALHAQSFTPAAGYAASALFSSSAGFTISAFNTAANGDVYYIETDNAFTAPARLVQRTAALNYAVAATLYTFAAPRYGSIVEVSGSRVFFGESDNFELFSIQTDGTGLDSLGTLVFHYDLEVAGGSLYFSASPDGFGRNKVFKFELVADGLGGQMLGTGDVILDTDPDGPGGAAADYSGPIAFDSTGALLYGANKASIDGIYRYTSAEVAGAVGPAQLTLVPPANRIFANGQNQFLAREEDARLFQTSSPFGGTAVANRYDLTTLTSQAVGSGDANDFFSGAGTASGTLFLALTDSATNNTTVYGVVPEPSAGVLAAFGLLGWAARRRRVC